jgi:hypothetical protein
MDCKHCGIKIERVAESASEIEFVHSVKVNGAKYVICAFANPLNPGDFYSKETGYLIAEPTKAGKFEGMSDVDGEQFAHYSGVVL